MCLDGQAEERLKAGATLGYSFKDRGHDFKGRSHYFCVFLRYSNANSQISVQKNANFAKLF